MRSAIAVLDRASPMSFGMLAMVVRDEQGAMRTEGLAQPRDHELSADTYHDLLARGEALRLPEELTLTDSANHAALWLGSAFEGEADSQALALPPRAALPKAIRVSNGSLWILQAHHVYHTLEVWLQHAFRKSLRDNDPVTARLMSWALPDRLETRIALWNSTKAPEAEISWYARLQRDSGAPSTESHIARLFTKAREAALVPSTERVVGFTGLAKCGDKDIAHIVAQRRHIKHLSFGRWLAKEALRLGRDQTRPNLQDLGQTTLETRGALSFCLSVLEELSPAAQLATDVVTRSFVLESVRHRAVLDAVRFLVGRDRLSLFAAVRPANERKELLKLEQIHDVDAVMRHPTESEVEAVASQAVMQLDSSWGLNAEADKVLELV